MISFRPSEAANVAVLPALHAVRAALGEVPTTGVGFCDLSDAELLVAGRLIAESRDALGTTAALLAGEVARRSAPELGSDGLAQRTGFRTAEEYVKVATRSTSREALTAVRVGTLLNEVATEGEVNPITGEISVPTQPWLRPVATAIAAGRIAPWAAESIRIGLGEPNSAVSIDALTEAAERLCVEAPSVDPDRLLRSAKTARDELDAAGIAIREEERRQLRDFRMFSRPGGGGRATWEMDPETFATVKELHDRTVSPKLGGVRFVDGDEKRKADLIAADPRTPGQLASDVFLYLLKAGADADSRFLLGSGAPVVTVITTMEALDASADGAHDGHGFIEGQPDPVSIATIERLLCDSTVINLTMSETLQPINADREKRLFTKRQKDSLAVRDGGCMFPDCGRPPSWTEAHHVKHWVRDRGKTEVENGILLCRHHHLLVHNRGWEIARDSSDRYWLTPPTEVDPQQKPIELLSKSPLMRALHLAKGHAA